MKFFNEKLRSIRKSKKVRIDALASQIGVSRTTLWLWETGRIKPQERQIKLISKALDIPIDLISDLKPVIGSSQAKEVAHSFYSLSTMSSEAMKERQNKQLFYVESLLRELKEMNQSLIITRALMNSLDVMIYVKSPSMKYITANNCFFMNLSLDSDFKISGKEDADIFPEKESKINSEEDQRVILSGQEVRNREDYIPGTRRLKWGIISKIPIYDAEGKISGLVGCITNITERKKSEYMVDTFKNAINSMDETIWIAKNIKEKDGRVSIINPIYFSFSNIAKAYIREMGIEKLSLKEQLETLKTNIIYDEYYIKPDIAGIKANSCAEGRYKVRLSSDLNSNVKMKEKIYYNSEIDIYVGIISEDKEDFFVKNLLDSVAGKLRAKGVNEQVIKEVVARGQ